MKFGQQLKESLFPDWRFYYIDYDRLKRYIKARIDQGFDENDERTFVEMLERELEKVGGLGNVGETKRHVQYCQEKLDSMQENPDTSDENYQDIEDEINQVIQEFNQLAHFSRLNYSGFIKIVKKHDKHSQYTLKPMFMVRLNARPFYKENFEPLLLNLSRMYHIVRHGGKIPNSTGKAQASGAQNFVRQTTKYWVHPDNVMELKLYVLRYLPVLIYKAKGSNPDEPVNPAIASVYFDNDDFELYRGRLEKTEGAQAIRLRWYGNTNNTEIFVERKTHREDWTGEKSVKERFSIKEKHVNDYLHGEFNMQKSIEKMRERGAKTDEDLDNLATLSSEIQQTIQEKQLHPVVRTFYNRTAFQLPGDARVRISLDTELCMIREDNYDGAQRSGNNWRRTDIDSNFPFPDISDDDICRFPYAVLEVKLQTHVGAEPPEWVTRLVNSDLVEAVPKFSKYIHGVSTLLESRVQLFPFWLPQMDRDIRRSRGQLSISHSRESLLRNDSHTSTRDVSLTPTSRDEVRINMHGDDALEPMNKSTDLPTTATTEQPSTHSRRSGTSRHRSRRHQRRQYPSSLTTTGQLDDRGASLDNEDTPLLGSRSSTGHHGTESDDLNMRKNRGMSFFHWARWFKPLSRTNNRQEIETRPSLQTVGTNMSSSSQRGGRNGVPFVAQRIPGKRIAIPVRVEPKVFFANERTFLSWLNFTVVLGSLALGLLNFGDSVGRISGAIFTVISMVAMVYALAIYQWRAAKIRNREAGPYDDRFGPTLLVVVLLVAVIINFWLKFSH
ncbi:hypothetical protein IWQ61_002252 [Dispira simplex]|nr:hypothetical protein IWQ61_002252 [Dispira simplex]